MANKQAARIVGAGMTALYKSQPLTAVELMVQALQLAVDDTHGLLSMRDIDTLIALPSLMSEQHFMIGHAVAQQVLYVHCLLKTPCIALHRQTQSQNHARCSSATCSAWAAAIARRMTASLLQP